MDDPITIQFLPTRLNAAPVVFRGMTGREVGLMAIAGFFFGLVPGIAGTVVTEMLPVVPTCMFVMGGLAIWYGGTVMRRLRRGRPETWLYRKIQWIAATLGFNSDQLIVTTAVYRPGRDRRRPVGDTL